jgi:hypothetical protein
MISMRWGGSPKALTSGASRWITILAALAVMLASLTAESAEARWPRQAGWHYCAPGVRLSGHSDRLDKSTYDGVEVGGLSGIAHDQASGRYYAVLDNQGGEPSRVYTLSITAPRLLTFSGPSVEGATVLHDSAGPFDETSFDGEAIAVTPDGTLLIASETEPSIREFALDGALIDELAVPASFLIAPAGEGRENESLEGLTMSPSGEILYSATESALLTDGEGQIRLLRHDWAGSGQAMLSGQFYYQTDPGLSVGELLALSEAELLVLERTFVPDVGNTIRIFLTSTAGAPDVSDILSLDGAGVEALPKKLLVDIGTCPPGDATAKQPQPNPLLDNFEGLAWGPRDQFGDRTLYVLSDDNFNTVQVTRLIALSIDEDLLQGP